MWCDIEFRLLVVTIMYPTKKLTRLRSKVFSLVVLLNGYFLSCRKLPHQKMGQNFTRSPLVPSNLAWLRHSTTCPPLQHPFGWWWVGFETHFIVLLWSKPKLIWFTPQPELNNRPLKILSFLTLMWRFQKKIKSQFLGAYMWIKLCHKSTVV